MCRFSDELWMTVPLQSTSSQTNSTCFEVPGSCDLSQTGASNRTLVDKCYSSLGQAEREGRIKKYKPLEN